jgi:hypothetical protein
MAIEGGSHRKLNRRLIWPGGVISLSQTPPDDEETGNFAGFLPMAATPAIRACFSPAKQL